MHHYYITGSSKGLGRAMAELCLGRGHSVTGISRNHSIEHRNYRHISCDLADTESLRKFEFPYMDKSRIQGMFLINNAATIAPLEYAGRQNVEEILRICNLNITAVATLCNLFIKENKDLKGEKVILNITSGAAQRPMDGIALYCASKAAIDMYTRTLAMEQEISDMGFKVAAVAPGIVDTLMQDRIREADSRQFSRIDIFRNYKENNELDSPEGAARKVLDSIKNININENVVYSVKE